MLSLLEHLLFPMFYFSTIGTFLSKNRPYQQAEKIGKEP
jgi:hypothetical protein